MPLFNYNSEKYIITLYYINFTIDIQHIVSFRTIKSRHVNLNFINPTMINLKMKLKRSYNECGMKSLILTAYQFYF